MQGQLLKKGGHEGFDCAKSMFDTKIDKNGYRFQISDSFVEMDTKY